VLEQAEIGRSAARGGGGAGARESERVGDALGSEIAVSFWQLPNLIEISEKAGLSASKYRMQHAILIARPALLIAMVLVFLVVYVFLQSWRTAIIPIVAIPVSLIGTFAVLAYTIPKSMAEMGSPSYGYTYQLSDYPIVEEAYYDRNTKTWYFPVTDARQPVLAGASAGYLFTGASA